MFRFRPVRRPSALALFPLLALVPPASADTIYLLDGEPLEDVEIEEETLTSITYRDSGRLESVPSERVVRVEFERLPDELDEAEAVLEEGDLGGALSLTETYLERVAGGRRVREEWAVPFAAKRAIDLNRALGDLDGTLRAADRLLADHPESRYVPDAYLAKAEAQAESGGADQAHATLTEFQELVARQALPTRWRLECELALVLTDASLAGEKRREALEGIVSTAGDEHPLVRNRARLAIGESLIRQATAAGTGQTALLDSARAVFEKITEDPHATDQVLAGAYAGLGDCLFWAVGDNQRRLYEAGMNYLRVAVLYKEQSRYVAKSMFYAGRCFDQLDADEHKAKARKLYLEVLREFPESGWAEEAKNFL